MKNLFTAIVVTLALMPALAFASVRVYNSSGTNLGTYTDLKLANGLSVSQVSGKAQVALTAGDGTTSMGGFLQSQSSVSGDLTATSCGKTVTSDGTDDWNLPTITSALYGCRYTFIVGTANGSGRVLKVDAATGNQILLLTNSSGDSVTADNTGESLVLEAINAGWAPVGSEKGTWTDSN